MNKKPMFNGPEKKDLPKRTSVRKTPIGAKVRYQKPKEEKRDNKSAALGASSTSWGSVASWYDNHLEKDTDSYHAKVVHPNLIRMIGDVKGKHVFDLACGQGIFSRSLAEKGAFIIGADISKELIALAEKNNTQYKFRAHYFATPSHDLYMVKPGTQDVLVCVLAIQNIEKLQETVGEISRVLKDNGKAYLVLNHPSFRNPTHTHWGYDEHDDKQYRRVEEYMSESKIKIDMTPGSKSDKKFTVSFHRPLQVYVKAFAKYGLGITRLEEWVSHRESEKGPRQIAENISRKEIPLFMAIELMKIKD
jgi:2-polyprenyl-3-methyl-5-hydroxy-6-metoxy-1,4-benzoquinol methylase